MDYKLIEDVELDGIDRSDHPDYVDAFICAGTYDGREMTEEELDKLNEDGDFVHESLCDYLH